MKFLVDGLSTERDLSARGLTCLSTRREWIRPLRPCTLSELPAAQWWAAGTRWRRPSLDRRALWVPAQLRRGQVPPTFGREVPSTHGSWRDSKWGSRPPTATSPRP
ncbi:hypothetical protein GCM10027160_08990 [Streptomyces calidiresistens]